MPSKPLSLGDLVAEQQDEQNNPFAQKAETSTDSDWEQWAESQAKQKIEADWNEGAESVEKVAADPLDAVRLMYEDALDDYRSMLDRLRTVKFATLDAREAKRLDEERDRLHDRVKLLGQQLGKTEKAVFADILLCDRDLSDYELPEFKLLGRKEFLESQYIDSLNLDPLDVPEPYVGVETDDLGKEYQTVDDLMPDEVGIIFARNVSKCISLPGENDRRFAPLNMDDRTSKESVRRAVRFAADNGYKLLRYNTGCHNYSEHVFAIVVDQENLNLATDQIKRSRSEYGIRQEDMTTDVLEKDWQEHQKEVDFDIKSYYIQYPPELGHILYNQVWRKLNDPDYRTTDEMEMIEVEKALKANGYKLKDGKAFKVIDKAKERRGAERERSEEEKISGNFRRR